MLVTTRKGKREMTAEEVLIKLLDKAESARREVETAKRLTAWILAVVSCSAAVYFACFA